MAISGVPPVELLAQVVESAPQARAHRIEGHAQALVRLAAEPELRRKIVRAAWEKARSKFSLEQERANLLRILGLDDVR